VAEADMIVGTTAWFFVGGDQTSELERLDRIVGILLTAHALRKTMYLTHVCLFQMITGITMEWSIEEWSPTTSALLTAFIQARVGHSE
jgi:hypothetical protein